MSIQTEVEKALDGLRQGFQADGADLTIVWPEFAWVGGIGAVLFVAALMRFRKTLIEAQS